MNKSILIIIGIGCALIAAAGIMWYTNHANLASPEIMAARRQLYDKDPEVRAKAAYKLFKLGDKASIHNITKVILHDDRRDSIFGTIVPILSSFAPKEIMPELKKFLRDKDKHVRWAACYTLCSLDSKEAIPEIKKLLNNPEFRSYAIDGLSALGDRECIPEFITFLQSDSQLSALRALGKLEAKEAIPEIKKILYRSSFQQTFDEAEEILKKLGVSDEEIQKAKWEK